MFQWFLWFQYLARILPYFPLGCLVSHTTILHFLGVGYESPQLKTKMNVLVKKNPFFPYHLMSNIENETMVDRYAGVAFYARVN